MGRPRLIPQGQELIDILSGAPSLTYAEIHYLYEWGGNPKSVKQAAHRAGYHRQVKGGGGPLDVMSDEKFWGKVDETMKQMYTIKATSRKPQLEFVSGRQRYTGRRMGREK